MIGTLQTNKIKFIAAHVHWIHSVFKVRQLNEINKRAAQHNRVINVLIQVNISDEPQKGGCKASEIDELLIYAVPLSMFMLVDSWAWLSLPMMKLLFQTPFSYSKISSSSTQTIIQI